MPRGRELFLSRTFAWKDPHPRAPEKDHLDVGLTTIPGPQRGSTGTGYALPAKPVVFVRFLRSFVRLWKKRSCAPAWASASSWTIRATRLEEPDRQARAPSYHGARRSLPRRRCLLSNEGTIRDWRAPHAKFQCHAGQECRCYRPRLGALAAIPFDGRGPDRPIIALATRVKWRGPPKGRGSARIDP